MGAASRKGHNKQVPKLTQKTSTTRGILKLISEVHQSNKSAQRIQRVFDAQKALWLGGSLFAPPLINLTIVNSKALNTKMMPGRGQASHYEFGFVTHSLFQAKTQ